MEKGMLEVRDRYEKYVNECELKTPEEVAELFKEYTALIWDYKLVGYCNKFYHESTVVHRENCIDSTGADLAVSGTLGFESAVPDLKFRFVDIFAEEDGNGGYKFAQALYYDGKNEGYSGDGQPSGKSISEEYKYCFGLCWVDVRKLDGEWKQAEEWLVRDSLGVKERFTKDVPAEEIDNTTEQEAQ